MKNASLNISRAIVGLLFIFSGLIHDGLFNIEYTKPDKRYLFIRYFFLLKVINENNIFIIDEKKLLIAIVQALNFPECFRL